MVADINNTASNLDNALAKIKNDPKISDNMKEIGKYYLVSFDNNQSGSGSKSLQHAINQARTDIATNNANKKYFVDTGKNGSGPTIRIQKHYGRTLGTNGVTEALARTLPLLP